MVRKQCSVCGGSGKIRNPTNDSYYSDKIICPNCQGEGFVGYPEVPKKGIGDLYKTGRKGK